MSFFFFNHAAPTAIYTLPLRAPLRISTVFDAQGRRLGFLPLGTAGTLQMELPAPLPPTPFSRFGLLIPATLAFLCLVASLLGHRLATRRAETEPMPPAVTERPQF